MRFFTPKEFRAVLLFLAAGLVVLCYRNTREILSHYIPSHADTLAHEQEHRNDSVFAILSQQDYVRDSLQFWMPADSIEFAEHKPHNQGHRHKGEGIAPHSIAINSALAETLQLLPGVGESISARIVAYRSKRGRFRSLAELTNIHGIGEKLFSKIQPYLRLD